MADLDGLAAEMETDFNIRDMVRTRHRIMIDGSTGWDGGPVKASMKNIRHNTKQLAPFLRRMRTHSQRTAPYVPDLTAFVDELIDKCGLTTSMDPTTMHIHVWDIKRLLGRCRSLWSKMRTRPVKDTAPH